MVPQAADITIIFTTHIIMISDLHNSIPTVSIPNPTLTNILAIAAANITTSISTLIRSTVA